MSLYNDFKEKEIKKRKIKNKIGKFKILIFSGAAVVVATIFSLAFFKGKIISNVKISNHFSYGEKIDYSKASSFLGGTIQYEFREENSDVWKEAEPDKPGTYYVRAKSKNLFGMVSYSDPVQFAIGKKNIELSYSGDSITYGSFPAIAKNSDLIEGDTISDISLNYQELKDGKVKFSLESIIITDDEDKDVTEFYDITIEDRSLDVLKKDVNILVKTNSKVYDAEKFEPDVIIDGLAFDDEINDIRVVYDDHDVEDAPKNVGSYSYSFKKENKVSNSAGVDVSEYYNLNLISGTLTIEKRPLTLTSSSFSKEYDGTNLSLDFNVEADNLCAGHKVNSTFEHSSELKNAISTENSFSADILDSSNEIVTSNYSINYHFGKIEITPRKITLGLDFKDKIYDGNSEEISLNSIENFLISGTLPLGEEISIDSIFIEKDGTLTTEVRHAGSYRIYLSKDHLSFNNCSAENYEITLVDNNFEIYKRNVKLLIDEQENITYGETTNFKDNAYHYPDNALEDAKILPEDESSFKFSYGIQFTAEDEESVSNIQAGVYYLYILSCSFSKEELNQDYNFDTTDTIRWEVLKKDIVIKPNISGFEFNGTYHSFDNNLSNIILEGASEFDISNIDGKYNFTFVKNTVSYSQIKDAGIYQVKFTFADLLNNNYNFIYDDAEIEITKRQITLNIIEDHSKIYDGKEYKYLDAFGNYLVDDNSFLGSDDVKIVIAYSKYANGEFVSITSVKDVGTYQLQIINIEARNGTDLDNYDITYGSNILFTIEKRMVTVSPYISDFVYSGQSAKINSISTSGIADGEEMHADEFVFYLNGNQVDEARNCGTYTVEIVASSLSCSNSLDNYNISFASTIFTINPRFVHFKINEVNNFEYNGQSYVYSNEFGNFEYYDDSLDVVSGESLKIIVEYYLDNIATIPLNAGHYLINIIAVESGENTDLSNYAIDISDTEEFDILTRKLTISPTLVDLTYDGNYHDFLDQENNYEIVSGSFVENETMRVSEFRFDNNSSFSIKNADTYIVTISAFDPLNGTNASNYDFTFEESTVTIYKRVIEISLISFEDKIYDGNGIIYSTEYQNFIYASNDENKQIVDGENIRLICNFTRSYDNTSEIVDSAKDYGMYLVNVTSVIGDDNTLVSNYDIKYISESSFEIFKRSITIELVADNFIYDGNQRVFLNYTVVEGNIIDSDNVYFRTVNYYLNGVFSENYLLNAGLYQAVIDESSFSSDASNYEITCLEKSIEVLKREITLDLYEMEDKVFDGEVYFYEDAFENYSISSSSANQIVDNESFKISVIYYEKVGSDWALILSPLDVGEYKVCYDSIIASSTTLLSNYEIIIGKGEFEFSILKKTLDIVPKDYQITYDGKNHGSDTFEYVYNVDILEISINCVLSLELNNVINVGSYNLYVSSYSSSYEKLERNFDINFDLSTLIINPKTINVKLESMSSVYDGKAKTFSVVDSLDKHQGIYNEVIAKDRDKLKLVLSTVSNIMTNVKTYSNVISYQLVMASDNITVDSNYEIIESNYGDFEIVKRHVKITSSDANFVFNGDVINNPLFDYEHFDESISRGLVDNHSIIVKASTSCTNVGTYQNILDYLIKDSLGDDVTNNYEIEKEFGAITITKLELNIIFKDMPTDWIFNGGNPLSSITDYYEIVEELNRFTLTMDFNISNKYGESVSSNVLHVGNYIFSFKRITMVKRGTIYYCNYENGIFNNDNIQITPKNLVNEFDINVTPLKLVLKTGSSTFVYDGLEHSYLTGYDVSILEEQADEVDNNVILSLSLSVDRTKEYAVVKEIGDEKDNVFSLTSTKVNEGDIIYQYEYGMIKIDNRYNLDNDVSVIYSGKNIIVDGMYTIYDNVQFTSYVSDRIKIFNGIFYFQLVDENGNYLTDSIKDEGEYILKLIDAEFENAEVQVVKNEITLSINPRTIDIKPKTLSYLFDGFEHGYSGEDWEYLSTNQSSLNLLANVDSLSIIANTTTKFYTKQIYIDDYVILDSSGNELKHSTKKGRKYLNYIVNITSSSSSERYKYAGMIKITARKITIETNSAEEKIYDGKPIEYDFEYWKYLENKGNGLYQGHVLRKGTDSKVEISIVSSRRNDVDIHVYDSDGVDVTNGYQITYTGVIKIKARPIKVLVLKNVDAYGKVTYTKNSDGTVYTSLISEDGYMNLVSGETLGFKTTINPTTGNEILIKNIVDGNGKNVSNNYSITISD